MSQLWNKVYQRTFNHVKTTSQVVMAYPDYFYRLVWATLKTDASSAILDL